MNGRSKYSTTAALSNEGRVAVVLLSGDDDYPMARPIPGAKQACSRWCEGRDGGAARYMNGIAPIAFGSIQSMVCFGEQIFQ
ncbi:hypothetical protein PRIO_6443 [Paenibacillus riograndensis SBR5]|uniref:Uncharacterized protein n=1 Tax=Paenibacillus riograndensis SBR5 TaxID=1073571 RepID=A0A0E4HFM4_9BACL|nr:hypothetical protein PRIO_6443 [Paenibacillus riograndensis SBR5]